MAAPCVLNRVISTKTWY